METLNKEKTSQEVIQMANTTRKIEVFTAGCPLCKDTVELVNRLSCPSCDVTVVDMHDIQGATRARQLGVRSVPAVAINDKLVDCCAGRGPDEASLRSAGLGQPIG
jgi:glutaredoxin